MKNAKPWVCSGDGSRPACIQREDDRSGVSACVRPFPKVDVGNGGCKFVEHRPVFRRGGCAIKGFGDELCHNQAMPVPKRARQICDESQQPSCLLDSFGERGARASAGEIKVPPQVSVFMNDVKGDMPLEREGDSGQAVACFFVGCKSPRFVRSDFSAEGIEVFKSGVH